MASDAIARSWMARPVESKTVISSALSRFFSPITTSPKVPAIIPGWYSPVLIGTLISPEWNACEGSSTKTRARERIFGSSSSLPGASAPIALICVPGCIHSLLTKGVREGVVVTRISQSQARSKETLSAGSGASRAANAAAWALSGSIPGSRTGIPQARSPVPALQPAGRYR